MGTQSRLGIGNLRPKMQEPQNNNNASYGAAPPSTYGASQPQQSTPSPPQGTAQPAGYQNSAPAVMMTAFGSAPQPHKCQYCGYEGMTDVKYEAGMLTFLLMLVICLIVCCLAFIPLLVNDCKDCYHYCAQCHRVVGVSKRL